MKQYTSVLCSIYGIDIYGYINVYDSKDEFLSEHCKKSEDEKLSYLKERIRYDSGGRIGEVGWGLSLNPFGGRRKMTDISKVEGKNILYYGMRHGPKYLMTDFADGHNLYRIEGDILFSKPCSQTPNRIGSEKYGKRIGRLNTRYGFSDLDEYGYQFAVYNKELKLEPI